jgi:hypothetical protein
MQSSVEVQTDALVVAECIMEKRTIATIEPIQGMYVAHRLVGFANH